MVTKKIRKGEPTLSKKAIEINILNLIKNIYKKLQIISHNAEKHKALSLRPVTRQRQALSPLLVNIILGDLPNSVTQEKE